jgi:hypothetical protein
VKSCASCLLFVFLVALPSAARAEAARPTLFLRCPQTCFESYLHERLSYFDFVRAPQLADITLLVVRQPAGNGGERFTVRVAQGAELIEKLEATRTFTAQPGATDHAVRDALVQVALRALHTALESTPHEQAFELELPGRDGVALSALHDPWDYWVIAPELGGEADGERGHYYAELTGSLTVRRVTEASKVRLRGSYTRALSGYDLDDEGWLRGDVYAWETRALYALSIGRHWALGATVTGRGSEFENLERHVHGGPLGELNLFPYVESQRRQLRLVYQVGPWASAYLEPTEAGLMHELRPYHALSIIADAHQPWGSVQWAGQLNMFIDDPKLYRLSTGASITLELFRGLALGLEGKAAYVRDLVNLRGREITDDELILWTAQQRTDYTFEVGVSFIYTFGSIHNTIVNPRFERVDIEEE